MPPTAEAAEDEDTGETADALYTPGTASYAPASYAAAAPAAPAADDPYPGPQIQSIDEAPPTQRYYPYGEQRGTSQAATDYRYTGQREEDEIGLYYYDARWYDPALGRFIQPDPVIPQTGRVEALNRYSYVYNDPLKYVDEDGHFPTIVVGIVVGALAGAGVSYVTQVVDNRGSGMTLQDAATNVDLAQIGAAAIGGAIAGATLGIGTAAIAGGAGAAAGAASSASASTTLLLGGVGGALGGQASAVAEASLNELGVGDTSVDASNDQWNWGRVGQRSQELGLGDPTTIAYDFAGGMLAAGAGRVLEKTVKPIIRHYASGFQGGFIKNILTGDGIPLYPRPTWQRRAYESVWMGLYGLGAEVVENGVSRLPYVIPRRQA